MAHKQITADQAKEICERQASAMRISLLWLGEQRCKLFRGRRELGEMQCSRPYLPVCSSGSSVDAGLLREAISDEVWQFFPAERSGDANGN